MIQYLHTLLFIGLVLVGETTAIAKPLEEKRWYEASSTNFTIYSRLNRTQTTELLRQLEVLRALMTFQPGLRDRALNDTYTIVFANGREWSKVVGEDFSTGFQAGIRENTILMVGGNRRYDPSRIGYRYAHYLVATADGGHYPKWYREGFAAYIAGTQIRGTNVDVFRASRPRATRLRTKKWITSEELLAPSDFSNWARSERSMFYAQSWALVYFLHNRPDSLPKVRQGLSHYLALMENGGAPVESFEFAFQLDAREIENAVSRFLREECCVHGNIPLETLIPDFAPKLSRAAPSRVAYVLGRVAMTASNYESAAAWMILAGADDSLRGQALSSLGSIRGLQERYQEAEELLESARSLAPDDPTVILDHGNYLLDRARALQGTDVAQKYLDEAVHAYLQIAEGGDLSPEFYVGLGSALLLRNEAGNDATTYLEIASAMLPSLFSIRVMLATSYEKDGRTQDSLRLAKHVLAWNHEDPEMALWAGETIERLELTENEKTGQ